MLAIRTVGLEKSYKTKKAVCGLNLNVEEGTVFSLLGVNGAGKTTTVKMLTGLTKPTGGEAYVLGKSITKELDEVKKIINLSPQETAIAPKLCVEENLTFMAGIYSVKNAREKVTELSEKFHLDEVKNQRAGTLSGGWQRRLSIAMALINDPAVLFLDEPTLGLDVIARRELWQVIRSLKGKITVILTTHYMEEAEALSDGIGVMSQGKLICSGTAAELKRQTNCDNFEDAFVKLASAENAFNAGMGEV